jgi:hypothetical protein
MKDSKPRYRILFCPDAPQMHWLAPLQWVDTLGYMIDFERVWYTYSYGKLVYAK